MAGLPNPLTIQLDPTMRCWGCDNVELSENDQAILAGPNYDDLLSQPKTWSRRSFILFVCSLVIGLLFALASIVCVIMDAGFMLGWAFSAFFMFVSYLAFSSSIIADANKEACEEVYKAHNLLHILQTISTRRQALDAVQTRLHYYQSKDLSLTAFSAEARLALALAPKSLFSTELSDLLQPYYHHDPFWTVHGRNPSSLVSIYPPVSLPTANHNDNRAPVI